MIVRVLGLANAATGMYWVLDSEVGPLLVNGWQLLVSLKTPAAGS